MCLINQSSGATVAAIIGALTGIFGTWILWKTQIRYEKKKVLTDEIIRRSAAGHNAMMILEAQRTFLEGLEKHIAEYAAIQKKIEDIPSIYANYGSIPRIDLAAIGFLTDSARDKKILPKLLSMQQNFDQTIDLLNRCSEERRSFHFASRETYEAFAVIVGALGDQLSGSVKRTLAKYPETQALLENGLKESINGFTPIYKR